VYLGRNRHFDSPTFGIGLFASGSCFQGIISTERYQLDSCSKLQIGPVLSIKLYRIVDSPSCFPYNKGHWVGKFLAFSNKNQDLGLIPDVLLRVSH